MNIKEQLVRLTDQLESDTASLDAQVLLASILNRSRTWVLAHPEANLDSSQQVALDQALSRLGAGTPLPYVLGHWEFFGLDFDLTPDVLIPRPETEMLVELALIWLEAHPQAKSLLEIGTGSGCLAISIARNAPRVFILATDISIRSLMLARKNARKHNVSEQMQFIQADMWAPFASIPHPGQTFNLICSNPPYVPTGQLKRTRLYGREPTLALDGGPDGTDHILELLQGAYQRLSSPGLLLIEVDSSHAQAVRSYACGLYGTKNIQVLKDLAGHKRFLRIQR